MAVNNQFKKSSSLGRCKWSFKNGNYASLYYNKHERLVKTLASITNNLKVGVWVTGHIWTQGQRNQNEFSVYLTPLNPRVFFILHHWNQSNVEKSHEFKKDN